MEIFLQTADKKFFTFGKDQRETVTKMRFERGIIQPILFDIFCELKIFRSK
jgi:hypothetical protein